MHSIRFKITAITITAILLTILCVFGVSYVILKGESNRSSVEMLNLIGQDTRKSVEKYTDSIEQSIDMISNIAASSLDRVILAENGAIGSIIAEKRTPEQQEQLDTYLTRYCNRVQETFTDIATHTHGIDSYYYCISPDISENVHGFYYSRAGKTGFEEREPLDARVLDPNDTEHNAWYFTAVKRGRPSWVGPYRDHYLGNVWIYSYIIPIYRSGTFIGVVGMDIPVETLVEQVRSIKVYKTGFVALLDADDRVLYHPNREFGTKLDSSNTPFSEDIFERDNNGDMLIRFTMNGSERQMSFCTMSSGMKLVIVAPTIEINAAWFRLARNNLLVAILSTALFGVIIALAMRAITRPLLLLTKASQSMADEKYNAVLNYNGRDEIGTLTRAFREMRDQIRRYIEDLNHQLLTDKLTGLPNIRHFFRLAISERNRLLEEGKKPVMLYFDIIGMKHYNRQYGFEAGDQRICKFAEILSGHFGEYNVCHFSGDHFAAVTHEDQVEESIHAFFQKCQNISGEPLLVRVGIYPNRLEDVDVSVACDRAKYACDKNKGVFDSCFSWFDENMMEKDEIYRYIYSNLDNALSKGWVKVYYQPIIRTADGKVCDEEALSRWIDPVKGFLSPADFIPALEEAKLIYKLDLYVLDQVLKKMKLQAEAGIYVVPQSVNLSRSDFDSCDIVEEIRRRVDDAGIGRNMITIEITESIIGSDFDFMKEQVTRFRSLGFPVWMDDFGSGYSSLDVLQQIHFDLIKFDMRFMERFDEGEESKIILTELMKMAIGLGMETVCEGVEKSEQVEFLREIGCTRIQGYYYSKSHPFEEILEIYKKGGALEFENSAEAEYYATTGRINLYDMSVLVSDDDENLRQYFNTLPMSLLEVNGTKVRYNRCNQSYRDFLQRTFGIKYTMEEMDYSVMPDGPGVTFMSAVIRCSRDGKRSFVDEKINEDTTLHALVRRVAVNPVTGTTAVAAAVLAIIKEGENAGANYAHVAKALSSDYVNLYYVNLDTEKFTEYNPDATHEDLELERHGEHFFSETQKAAKEQIYKDDLEYFLSTFNRENIEKCLDTQGTFTLTYRLMMGEEPTFVNLKAVRMPGDRSHIIIGINNVDTQMRQKETLARIQAEEITYSRISALTQGFICIYAVDPVTNHYVEYSATADYARLNLPKEGEDLFAQALKESPRHVYPDDLAKFQSLFNRERILEAIEKNGFYGFQYRMILDGEPIYVSLKAALVEEQDGSHLLIGINNVDEQVRHELDYQQKLSAARTKANLDTLTGVKNRTAYDNMSEMLAKQIAGGQPVRYAIVLCRVHGLEQINETEGYEAGDKLIQDACAIICEVFKHSPVFRVTGDQFAAIVQGHDYEMIDELVKKLEEDNRKNKETGGPLIACGMAKYEGSGSVTSIFELADNLCCQDNERLF